MTSHGRGALASLATPTAEGLQALSAGPQPGAASECEVIPRGTKAHGPGSLRSCFPTWESGAAGLQRTSSPQPRPDVAGPEQAVGP